MLWFDAIINSKIYICTAQSIIPTVSLVWNHRKHGRKGHTDTFVRRIRSRLIENNSNNSHASALNFKSASNAINPSLPIRGRPALQKMMSTTSALANSLLSYTASSTRFRTKKELGRGARKVERFCIEGMGGGFFCEGSFAAPRSFNKLGSSNQENLRIDTIFGKSTWKAEDPVSSQPDLIEMFSVSVLFLLTYPHTLKTSFEPTKMKTESEQVVDRVKINF